MLASCDKRLCEAQKLIEFGMVEEAFDEFAILRRCSIHSDCDSSFSCLRSLEDRWDQALDDASSIGKAGRT